MSAEKIEKIGSEFLTFKLDDKQVKDMLQAMIDRNLKVEPALKSVCEQMLISIDDRWKQQVDPSGKKWKALSPFTIKMKRSQSRLLPILQSTGTARRTIRYQVSNDRAAIGTGLSYMADHQLGTNGLTKREFLGFSEDDITEIREIVGGYISRGDRNQ